MSTYDIIANINGIMIIFILTLLLISLIKILFIWYFLRSAIREGIKDAIKETLIDTGIINNLNIQQHQNDFYTEEEYGEDF